MERKKPRTRRSFTPAFKADVVDRCHAGDRTIAQVARDVDLTESAVRKWVEQTEVDDGHRAGLTSEECKELAGISVPGISSCRPPADEGGRTGGPIVGTGQIPLPLGRRDEWPYPRPHNWHTLQ